MSFLVTCTFDLANADGEDYAQAYTDLALIGLKKVIIADDNTEFVIPTTTVAGEFNGQSSLSVRDYVRERIKQAFINRGFSAEIFIVVGDDWAWGAAHT